MKSPNDQLRIALNGAITNLTRARENFAARLFPLEVGTVTTVSTGIAKVSGLPGVGFDELVEFPGNLFGIAFNLDEEDLGIVLLGDCTRLNAGVEVRRTGRVMDVPIGNRLLGRVLDPLGRPLDRKGPITASQRLPIEHEAPHIMDRAPVTVPLQTGIKVIDALIPVGRGQRELILGDRQTGKTAIALDTIVNQGVQKLYASTAQLASAPHRSPRSSPTSTESARWTTPSSW